MYKFEYQDPVLNDINDKTGKITIKDEKNEEIGYLLYEPENYAGYLVINKLEVKEEHRRKKIGSRLIEQVKYLSSSAYRKRSIYVYIAPVGNVRHSDLKVFYEKNGFIVVQDRHDDYEGKFEFACC